VTSDQHSPCVFKRRRAVTVERLLDAALDTFAELGFQAASVEDICRRGGFTRGAFYSSFKTKDELFVALFRREAAARLAELEQQLAGLEHEADPVAAVVERCLASFRDDRRWERVSIEYALLAARTPAAAEVLAQHQDGLFARLATLIETTASRSGITLAIPAGQLARICAALTDGIALHEMPSGPRGPGESLQHPALLLLLRGVTAATPPAPHNPAPLVPTEGLH
jgi:AcrR family transcriptional regulator